MRKKKKESDVTLFISLVPCLISIVLEYNK